VQQRALEHKDKSIPKPADFVESIVYVVIFGLLRLLVADKIFIYIGDKVLPKNKWPKEVREHKVDRFGGVLFKLCYFLFITAYGYYLLHDKEWMPPILGGNGDIVKCFNGLPYPVVELDQGIKMYYMLQLGYHLHSFLFQFRLTHRSDFYEMVLHHVVTLFLICFSYLNNFTRIGSLVFFTHDFPDLFGYAIKSVVDTNVIGLIITAYSALLVSWGFGRLFVFPAYIIRTGFNANVLSGTSLDGYLLLNVLMVVLLVLHLYWYSLFLKMGFTMMSSGKAEDIVDKLKPKQKPE